MEFLLAVKSDKQLADVFSRYTDDDYQFNRTGVKIKLYARNVDFVSRSQARRMLAGLDKFKSIELDFSGVSTIGQAFADEIFRIWSPSHHNINLIVKNTNKNIEFMIKRSCSQ